MSGRTPQTTGTLPEKLVDLCQTRNYFSELIDHIVESLLFYTISECRKVSDGIYLGSSFHAVAVNDVSQASEEWLLEPALLI